MNKVIVFSLIVLLLVAAVFTLKDILIPIFIGVLAAYVLNPLYVPLRNRIKKPNLSTFLFIFLITLIIAIPLYFFVPAILKEIIETYMYLQKINISNEIHNILILFLNEQLATAIAVQSNLFISKFFSFSLQTISNIFADLPTLMLKVVVFLFTFYFVLRDSHIIKEYLLGLSPFSKHTEQRFAAEFRNITNSVLLGQILIGIIQGLTLGAGLWILGVPNALFLTALTIVASIIPIVGAWIVWVPVSLFLMASGQVSNGLILFLYGFLFVSLIDNFLRPYFISRKSNLNIFVAIIGIIFLSIGIPRPLSEIAQI